MVAMIMVFNCLVSVTHKEYADLTQVSFPVRWAHALTREWTKLRSIFEPNI
jgi:hypothetical protein